MEPSLRGTSERLLEIQSDPLPFRAVFWFWNILKKAKASKVAGQGKRGSPIGRPGSEDDTCWVCSLWDRDLENKQGVIYSSALYMV